MRLIRVAAAVMVLGIPHLPSGMPASSHQVVGQVVWTEPSGFSHVGARCSLEFAAHNGPSRCSYTIRYTRKDDLESTAAQHGSAISSDPNAAVELMIPIRVSNSVQPQILVSRRRSNWGDYRLYGVRDDSLVELWGISHRDPACMQWVASRGVLDCFVVYDRWQPERARAHLSGHPGHRWELRQVYRFNPKVGAWAMATRKWEEYEFGKPVRNKVINSPADCTFLYPRK
jgi:hypothetical protein